MITLPYEEVSRLRKGERVLITEDVVTKGGRVEEALKIIRDLGGVPVAITVIVDRSSEPPSFGTPFISLAALSFPTYQEESYLQTRLYPRNETRQLGIFILSDL